VAGPTFDICVIGGGAGGLVVAAGGASLGAKIALVEKHVDGMGGDCLHYGCVPSKTLLRCARIAHSMREAARYGVPPCEPQISITDVMRRVASVIDSIQPNDSPERFRGLGVDITFGAGRFVSPACFQINGRALTARRFVIATGSRPSIPPIPGLESIRYLTNETVFSLKEQVPALTVIGAGPIGAEMAQAFVRLGSKVTVVDLVHQILPREDADVAATVQRQLEAEGVRFHLGVTPVHAEIENGAIALHLKTKGGADKILGTHLLVAAGRKANIEDLGLEAAGVQVEQGRIVHDDRLRTTNRNIYVCGDAAGAYQFTHLAEHHAGVILRNAIFRLPAKVEKRVIPWCTFTDPEAARVGLSETEAQTLNAAYKVYMFPFDEVDRAKTEGETTGFAKIVTDRKGRLLGATIVGARAGELIHEYVLAIARKMKAKHLSAAIHVYPTLAQINRRVADQRLREGLTPTAKRWIKRIYGLRGEQ
jgi:pyruvate/2-oxoglutarate dehydrogenase complex dihydrolipoamide dehydrogenase (E3) component